MSLNNMVDINDPYTDFGSLTPDDSITSNEDSKIHTSSYQQYIFNGGTSNIKYMASDLLPLLPSDNELSLLEEQQSEVTNRIS